MSESAIQPQYNHSCDFGTCEFLGPYKYADVEYDLYYCAAKPGEYPSLRARFGNREDFNFNTEYCCGIGEDMSRLHQSLWQARRQARMRGFIK